MREVSVIMNMRLLHQCETFPVFSLPVIATIITGPTILELSCGLEIRLVLGQQSQLLAQ
jgi:hypothetical protein